MYDDSLIFTFLTHLSENFLYLIKYLNLMQSIFMNKPYNTEIMLFELIESENIKFYQKNIDFDCFFSAQYKTSIIDPCGNHYQYAIKELSIYKKETPVYEVPEYMKRSKKRTPKVTPDTRLTNYVFPNIVREVKHCLFNSFQAENKHLYNSLWQFFKVHKINYQVWAFDAILVCLIFLRDKTYLLTSKKYFSIIDVISSTLYKFLDKFLTKTFSLDQREFLISQYNFCLNHLKVYDDVNNNFDSLSGRSGEVLRYDFFESVLLNRRGLRFRFVNFIKEIQDILSPDLFYTSVMEKIPSIKEMENNGSNNNEQNSLRK